MENEIVNRVQNSSLVSLDLDELLSEPEFIEFDLAEFLHEGLVLREKDFRTSLKELDTSIYEGKAVALHCSTDAILPLWSYMLVVGKLSGVASRVFKGDPEEARRLIYLDQIAKMKLEEYEGAKVIVKGCSDLKEKESIYTALSERLVPVVQSLMFGEPCSTVPIFKKPRN